MREARAQRARGIHGPIRLLALALAALALALASCAPNYIEPVLSEEEDYATLRGSTVARETIFAASQYMRVSRIDGGSAVHYDYEEPIRLAEGRHEVAVFFTWGSYHATGTLEATFEAGRAYVVRFEIVEPELWRDPIGLRYWIEDLDSGEPLGDPVLAGAGFDVDPGPRPG